MTNRDLKLCKSHSLFGLRMHCEKSDMYLIKNHIMKMARILNEMIIFHVICAVHSHENKDESHMTTKSLNEIYKTRRNLHLEL